MPEILVLAFIMLLVLGAYWSLVIFPRQRDFSKRQKFVSTLSVGEDVITAGGIIGQVVEVRPEEGIAYVQLAEGVVVRMIAASLLQPFDPEELAHNARRGLGGSESAE